MTVASVRNRTPDRARSGGAARGGNGRVEELLAPHQPDQVLAGLRGRRFDTAAVVCPAASKSVMAGPDRVVGARPVPATSSAA